MNSVAIFWPMGALAALTFVVLMQVPLRRFRAVRQGLVTADDFALGESNRVPDWVAIANRNYMNLLESPTLFYVVSLMFFVTGRVTLAAVGLAWLYVVLRAAHSYIHLTSNRVMLRMRVFRASVVVLMILWIAFFIVG